MNEVMLQPVSMQPAAPFRLPPVPWRDPHTVSPAQLKDYIQSLEVSCEQNPRSADLRTCLGMAYAMNYEVYKSMDALELAVELEPEHFFAQFKYAELHCRLRALIKAEREALKALELGANAWELSLARRLLHEIRTLHRAGTQKPEWTKPLGPRRYFSWGCFYYSPPWCTGNEQMVFLHWSWNSGGIFSTCVRSAAHRGGCGNRGRRAAEPAACPRKLKEAR